MMKCQDGWDSPCFSGFHVIIFHDVSWVFMMFWMIFEVVGFVSVSGVDGQAFMSWLNWVTRCLLIPPVLYLICSLAVVVGFDLRRCRHSSRVFW